MQLRIIKSPAFAQVDVCIHVTFQESRACIPKADTPGKLRNKSHGCWRLPIVDGRYRYAENSGDIFYAENALGWRSSIRRIHVLPSVSSMRRTIEKTQQRVARGFLGEGREKIIPYLLTNYPAMVELPPAPGACFLRRSGLYKPPKMLPPCRLQPLWPCDSASCSHHPKGFDL